MTKSEKIGFSIDIFLAALLGFLQSSSLISIYGVKPNLVLVFLVISIFLSKNLWQYFILLITSLIFLNYFSALSKDFLIFGFIMFIAFYFKKMFSEHEFLSIIILISVLTFIFYLVLDYKFIFNNFNLFTKELFLNLIIGGLFGFLYQKEIYSK